MKTTETNPIVCGTDFFSERAGHAIPYAYAALAREGAVCLLHIAKAGKADEKIELEALEAKLRALIPAEAEKRGVVTEVRIVESGDEGKTICEAAERFCADLVSIGSHGHSGMAAALMGSVAQAVTAHSRSPVLLVRGASTSSSQPSRRGAENPSANRRQPLP